MTTKRIFTLLLFCFILTNAYTQRNIYIGVGVGVLNSSTDFDFGCSNCDIRKPEFANLSAYFTMPVSIEFERTEHYSFAPTIHYSRIANSVFANSDSTTTNYRIDYLGLNLINKFKIFNDEFEAYAIFGPQFRKSIGVFSYQLNRTRVNRNDVSLKGFDINLRTGLGLSKVNRYYKIVLEWVYDFDFFDIDIRESFNTTSGKNSGIFVGLAFQINNRKNKE